MMRVDSLYKVFLVYLIALSPECQYL